jgi:hypothetical protein
MLQRVATFIQKGPINVGPGGWRVNAGRGVVVGQFEFPFLAGRGMAGSGDGN